VWRSLRESTLLQGVWQHPLRKSTGCADSRTHSHSAPRMERARVPAARSRGSGAADASPDRASGDVKARFGALRRRKGQPQKNSRGPLPCFRSSTVPDSPTHARRDPRLPPCPDTAWHPHALTSPASARHGQTPLPPLTPSPCETLHPSRTGCQEVDVDGSAHPPSPYYRARRSFPGGRLGDARQAQDGGRHLAKGTVVQSVGEAHPVADSTGFVAAEHVP
jgi:hypothetical protein